MDIKVRNGRPKYISELEDEFVAGPTWIVSLEVISSPKTKKKLFFKQQPKDRFLSVRSKQHQQRSGVPQDYLPREECHRHKTNDLRRYRPQLSLVESVK